jgi:hypothetical protein
MIPAHPCVERAATLEDAASPSGLPEDIDTEGDLMQN